MLRNHIIALGSTTIATILLTGAAFAKAPPKIPLRTSTPAPGIATVSRVSSDSVVLKVMGPDARSLTLTSSQISSKSQLSLAQLETKEQVMLRSTHNGWFIAKAPIPPINGFVTKVGSSSLVVKEMAGPGRKSVDKTVTFGHNLTVKSGRYTVSDSAIQPGDQIAIQGNQTRMIINILPPMPITGTVESLSNRHLTMKVVRPGHSETKTYPLSQVKVVKGPGNTASVSTLKRNELVNVQITSIGVTVQVMPTPPKMAKKSSPAVPKPGKAPKRRTLPVSPKG